VTPGALVWWYYEPRGGYHERVKRVPEDDVWRDKMPRNGSFCRM